MITPISSRWATRRLAAGAERLRRSDLREGAAAVADLSRLEQAIEDLRGELTPGRSRAADSSFHLEAPTTDRDRRSNQRRGVRSKLDERSTIRVSVPAAPASRRMVRTVWLRSSASRHATLS